MRQVIALLALVCAAGLLVAGCGGGGGSSSKPLTKAEYQTQMKAIGSELSNALGSAANANTAAKAATALEDGQTQLHAAADKIEAITPPEDVKKQHQDLADAVNEFADELDQVIPKLKAGDMSAITTLTSLPGLMKIQTAASAIAAKGYNIGSA